MSTHPTADGVRCPCLSGDAYEACCGRYHAGLRPGPDGAAPGPYAPTAEALMRSRYSAFAVGDADYLRATWHASTRPADLDLDDDLEWRRLDVLRTEAGGPFDTTGVVEFAAYHRSRADRSDRGRLHEVSRFVREGDRWYYVDGTTAG